MDNSIKEVKEEQVVEDSQISDGEDDFGFWSTRVFIITIEESNSCNFGV